MLNGYKMSPLPIAVLIRNLHPFIKQVFWRPLIEIVGMYNLYISVIPLTASVFFPTLKQDLALDQGPLKLSLLSNY